MYETDERNILTCISTANEVDGRNTGTRRNIKARTERGLPRNEQRVKNERDVKFCRTRWRTRSRIEYAKAGDPCRLTPDKRQTDGSRHSLRQARRAEVPRQGGEVCPEDSIMSKSFNMHRRPVIKFGLVHVRTVFMQFFFEISFILFYIFLLE